MCVPTPCVPRIPDYPSANGMLNTGSQKQADSSVFAFDTRVDSTPFNTPMNLKKQNKTKNKTKQDGTYDRTFTNVPKLMICAFYEL